MALETRWRRVFGSGLCGPFVATLVSGMLLLHVLGTPALGVPQGAYGPQFWPELALILLVAGMVVLCAYRAHACLVGRVRAESKNDEPATRGARVAFAITLIALYGAAFAVAGYVFATMAFLAVWLVFAHYRRPLRVVLVSVLGTMLPLYLLIKVAYMPLPRGTGVIEQATLQLYQWLRLF